MFKSSSAKVKALRMTQIFIKTLNADSSYDILLVSSPSLNHSPTTNPPPTPSSSSRWELMDARGCRLLTVLCRACIHACHVHDDVQLTQISYREQWEATDVGQPIKH